MIQGHFRKALEGYVLLFLTALAVLPSDPEPAGSDRVLDGWARPLTAKSCVLLLQFTTSGVGGGLLGIRSSMGLW